MTVQSSVMLLRRSEHRAVLKSLEDGHLVCFGQDEETNM